MQELRGETRLEIVPGASHLFEEPGALEQVARLAQGWFTQHLKPVARERPPRRDQFRDTAGGDHAGAHTCPALAPPTAGAVL